MSTFLGVMKEFPDIRVDFFRPLPGLPNPLAGFLSHIHSDHLDGLETFKSPFIYCSAATKELLVGLERKFSRLNYANGITEARTLHYRHLKKLLRTIPYETPTKIELSPGAHIQVTLFDANHCTGAAMFLFENEKHAALYTGDIRSEPWFVNNLIRNPLLIQYISGNKRLDCIYLDTSFIQPVPFPTKAEGLTELLVKVAQYPANTVFHFAAWTFGYEEVWMALAKALKSPIHVEKYKLKLYKGLVKKLKTQDGELMTSFAAPEAATLAGYMLGNAECDGILTSNTSVRLHSCEKGTRCAALKDEKVVKIIPIITRIDGHDVCEMGIGGGGHDLGNFAQIALDDSAAILRLVDIFSKVFPDQVDDLRKLIKAGHQSYMTLEGLGVEDMADIKLEDVVNAISESLHHRNAMQQDQTKDDAEQLDRIIRFPYSRHSSYEELCLLVQAFKPMDVWPCTSDDSKWEEEKSMTFLFSRYCTGSVFRYDEALKKRFPQTQEFLEAIHYEQRTPSPSGSIDDEVDESDSELSMLNRQSIGVNCDPAGRSLSQGDSTSTTDFRLPPNTVSLRNNLSVVDQKQGGDIVALSEEEKQRQVASEHLSGQDSLVSQHNVVTDARAIHRVLVTADETMPTEKCRVVLNGDARSQEIYEPSSASTSATTLHTQLYRRRSASAEAEGSTKRQKRPRIESDGDEEQVSDSSQYSDEENTKELPDGAFWDGIDDIWRCSGCGWEFDCASGECYAEGCDIKVQPETLLTVVTTPVCRELLDDANATVEVLCEEYEDYAQAYEAESDGTDQYEKDSFIDDGLVISSPCHIDHSEPEEEEEEEEEEQVEDIYRNDYRRLLVNHQALQSRLDLTELEYRSFRHDLDIFSSDDENEDAFYGGNSIPFALVEVETQDPVVTDVLINSQDTIGAGIMSTGLLNDSQASELSPERLAAREAAYEQALDPTKAWNQSLISVSDNHSRVEPEL